MAVIFDAKQCTVTVNGRVIPNDGIMSVNYQGEETPYGSVDTFGGARKFKNPDSSKEISFEITNDSEAFRWFKHLEIALKINDEFDTNITIYDGCQTDYSFLGCSYGGSETGAISSGDMPTTTFTFSARQRVDSMRTSDPW